MWKPLFRDSQEAFNNAISKGRLNTIMNSHLYAGKWMYMHTEKNGLDAFKNSDTRKYLYVNNDPVLTRSG